MSFVLYVVVLVVSVTSVMMGLDWLSTPPPPIPKSVQTVSAPAKPAAPAAHKTAADNKTADNADKKIAATKPAPQPSAATTGAASTPVFANTDKTGTAPAKSATSAVAGATVPAMAPQPDAAAPPAETAGSAPVNAANDALANADGTTTAMGSVGDANAAVDAANAAPRCDIQACTARYRSFNPADCTYQPFDGPRRLCTVGNPPSQASAASAGVQTSDASQPAASSACNYDACAEAYRSFDPATCTWQPYEGPRRLCEK